MSTSSPQQQPPQAPGKPRPFTVSEVLSQVRSCLDDNFLPLAVKGEVNDARQPRSGHLYFTLRDRNARLRIVCFRSTLERIPHRMRDGDELLVWGRITAYPATGNVQLVAEGFEPAGLGEAMAQRERLRRQLQQEGLFDPRRKRALPLFPRRIGLVTSPTGSAIEDVLSTLARRYPAAEVLLAPARTNGLAAGPDVAAALRALDQRGQCDVLLLVRGGGSREDLIAFDGEVVVRALCRCQTPTVVGVGHEDDTTLADLVADRRAPTPTGAAELVVPERGELLVELRARGGRLERALLERVARERRRLDAVARAHALRVPELLVASRRRDLSGAARRLELAHPRARLERRRAELEGLSARLARAAQETLTPRARALDERARRLRAADPAPRVAAARQGLARAQARLERAIAARLRQEAERLAGAAARLEGLSPLKVLARGYSLTRDAAGHVVTEAGRLAVGDEVETRLAQGKIRARVTEVTPEPERTGQ